MDPRERFQRVEAIFRSARELRPDERERFVSAECAGEATMREEVLGMLRVDGQAAGVLDRPALGDSFRLEDLAPAEAPAAAVPVRIGRYRIVGMLGEGGMGIVYEAEQAHPNRRVALKVISGQALSARSVRRFRQEAEVLGRLQHPGIGQIFEAGVDDWGAGQQPFLAMELVVGQPLLEFAADRDLGVPERLALLARICDAVQHAHQKGVVHRDLKPSNILVVETEGESASGSGSSHDLLAAQPKVLDFGVARVLDLELDGTTMQTRAGQVVGTVSYMSPEQAAGDVAAIDTRSDVYALGVIGYELLGGRLPHDLAGKRLSESLQIVREVPVPRLGAHDRRLRGDIETIIGKALELEPDRRYASAAEMAADLRRVLRDEPIQARRVGPAEQLWRFAQRNRVMVGSAALAVLALAASTVVSVRMAGIAHARAEEARRQSYRASLAAAAAALRFHEVVDARQELERAPVELRGWEWKHLWSRLDDSLMAFDTNLPTGTLVAFGPDGTTIAASSRNGGVAVWSIDGSFPPRHRTIEGNYLARWFTCLRFSADGSSLLLGSRRGLAAIDGATLEETERRESGTKILAIAPTLDRVATGDEPNRPIQVRSMDNGRVLLEIGRDSAAGPMVFSSDARLLAIADADEGSVTVHAIDDGRVVRQRFELGAIGDLCFDRDGRTLAVGAFDGSVHLLDLHGAGNDRVLAGHASSVTALAFSPDNSILASAASDHTVRLWDVHTGEALAEMQGNDATPTGIAFSPDGAMVATACNDGVIRMWSAAPGNGSFVLPTPGPVYGLAFEPSAKPGTGQRLWAACLGGEHPLRCWDLASLSEAVALGDGYLSAVAFDASGARLAVGSSQSGRTIVMDVRGEELVSVPGHWWRTDWVGFGADGSKLLSVGNSRRILVHDVATGRQLASRLAPGRTDDLGMRAALSPDRSLLAVGDDGAIVLLDAESLEERGRLEGQLGAVTALAFSPDGTRLASGSSDRIVRLWDVRQRRSIATMEGSADTIFALAFSPDGRRLASGGPDRIVRIWELAKFQELVRLNGHASYVYCLAWSPDGTCLASGGGDDTVRIWDTRPMRDVVGIVPTAR